MNDKKMSGSFLELPDNHRETTVFLSQSALRSSSSSNSTRLSSSGDEP